MSQFDSRTIKQQPSICKFLTKEPIPILKASLIIKEEWTIETLIKKINEIILNETNESKYLECLLNMNPTHKLVIEQFDFRLPKTETCEIIDLNNLIEVKMIPLLLLDNNNDDDNHQDELIEVDQPIIEPNTYKSSTLPSSLSSGQRSPTLPLQIHRSFTLTLPPSSTDEEEELIEQNQNLSPKPEYNDHSSPIPWVRSHLPGFRKCAPGHYDEMITNQIHQSSNSKSRLIKTSSKSRSNQPILSTSNCKNHQKSRTSINSLKSKALINSTFNCVSIPSSKVQSLPKRRKQISLSSLSNTKIISTSNLKSKSRFSLPNHFNNEIRSSKRLIYEIYNYDLKFKMASKQGPIRYPCKSNGINPKMTIKNLFKYLNLKLNQSWKIKIGEQVWINNYDFKNCQNLNQKINHHQIDQDGNLIINDWNLNLIELGVIPCGIEGYKNSPKIEIIRNWDL
ncbi:hypothetical protein CROQUDRAFT_670237 [Cronartium quercuum f. sp. fusiforme G11]|uniref:Uncharacterized protein n=1 Tax=Cronartium quercuum f. sp. fusiforme G11 TaxID=708437 RepID=A0A9P6NPQ9_9BASI|nr:hypothetical protein CROQUDRAFT_670237 [Cronartium quercuum f. sp. fusiforme G11]